MESETCFLRHVLNIPNHPAPRSTCTTPDRPRTTLNKETISLFIFMVSTFAQTDLSTYEV
jgi:hypothetical protein